MSNDLPALWVRLLAKDHQACARLISLAENDRGIRIEIQRRCAGRPASSVRIGITGAPGAGKSCLTAALAQKMLSAGIRVGILAVDPSSPFTGGALLGDRYRMHQLAGNPHAFIRSLASRNSRGGISEAVPVAADLLETAGFQWIFIETVGVGQVELDIMDHSDIVLLVLQPATGDSIQAMKAGVIEIADLMVINKSDLEGAGHLITVMDSILDLKFTQDDPLRPPVLPVQAKFNQGIDSVISQIQRLERLFTERGILETRRRNRLKNQIETMIIEQIRQRLDRILDKEQDLSSLLFRNLPDDFYLARWIDGICRKISVENPDGNQ